MKMNNRITKALSITGLILLSSMLWVTATFAHREPITCSGSSLNIFLYTDSPQVHLGDIISYSVVITDGTGSGPVVCNATGIVASLTTPDGIIHAIPLRRTALSNGERDSYPNIVTYTARAQDIQPNGTLTATANDSGVIHQNITDSQGGGNQGVNTKVLATLHVIKHVINDNGGSATASNFTINVTGTNVSLNSFAGSEAGEDVTLEAGSYSVTETDPLTNYLKSNSGDCSGMIAAGGTKTCTITNNDIFVQPPVTLPGTTSGGVISSGVPPVTLPGTTSGGVISSGVPPVTLPDTTTGGVISSGVPPVTLPGTTSGGVISSGVPPIATPTPTPTPEVVPAAPVHHSSGGGGRGFVSIPPVSPLIHVTKVPSPLALPAGGGMVTYTEKITNPGTVALSNIRLTDDKCSPMKYLSGDINHDYKLDPTETFTYTCQTNLTKTTTNIATAEGDANGLMVRSIAIATVVVSTPGQVLGIKVFPKTGLPPLEKSLPWNIFMSVGIFILVLISLVTAIFRRATNAPNNSLALTEPLRYAPEFKYKA